jgi:SET domain-containing protein
LKYLFPAGSLTTFMAKSVIRKALDRDFVRVGRSRIEGKGVFAKRKIHRGARIIEYKGKRRPAARAARLFVEENVAMLQHVYLFGLRVGIVIDGMIGGNESRFINHSCAPNCQAYTFEDRVYIYALRDIARGEELTFDYKLRATIGARRKKSDERDYPCHCGAENCRGTMLTVNQ